VDGEGDGEGAAADGDVTAESGAGAGRLDVIAAWPDPAAPSPGEEHAASRAAADIPATIAATSRIGRFLAALKAMPSVP
jgi:hypothetical protein